MAHPALLEHQADDSIDDEQEDSMSDDMKRLTAERDLDLTSRGREHLGPGYELDRFDVVT